MLVYGEERFAALIQNPPPVGEGLCLDDMDVGILQVVIRAEAGDGDCRCYAIAVRVVGEFAGRAVVEQVVVRILCRFAAR